MAFQKLTTKKATSLTPQVVTLIVDDSGSMSGTKAHDATEAMKNLVITMQSGNQGSAGYRFLLNIAKFGSSVTPLAEASRPESISLGTLSFTGDSGSTEMPDALSWGAGAVQKALQECRQILGYAEEACPNPLVVFFSDGANTGGDVTANAQAIKNIKFVGGNVDVVAVGIGMGPQEFPVMQSIASRPELAVNIDPAELPEFIAEVGATALRGDSPEKLIQNF
jgi:uncharacterized protein YegL